MSGPGRIVKPLGPGLDASPAVRRAVSQLEAVSKEHGQTLSSLSGRYLGRQRFTASGTYVPAAGCKRVVVEGVSGGGGGGGAQGGANKAGGGGGGSGVYFRVELIGPAGIAGGQVVIGAGGTGGSTAGATGNAGGATSITVDGTTFSVPGGVGGQGMLTVAAGDALGGGTASPVVTAGLDFFGYLPGQVGVVVTAAVWWGGAGGSSPYGFGGPAVGGDATGNAAGGFGAGGGGGASSGSGHAGGAGSAGLVIFWEFS